jgi:hypothetical protein
MLVEQQQVQEIGQLAFLDGEGAVHVGSAHVQGGVDGEAPVEGGIVQMYSCTGAGTGDAKIVAAPGVVDHTEMATPHEAAKN